MEDQIAWGDVGLSPRVRGNQCEPSQAIAPYRSIPACAGEPTGSGCDRDVNRVYPRVCGGTWPGSPVAPVGRGLSPRVRGNQRMRQARLDGMRSIPACAGEPASGSTGDCRSGVYPRVCGGTYPAPSLAAAYLGLSPRVRGNQPDVFVAHVAFRSIPACAGEPSWSSAEMSVRWVYPRVCGGTRNRPPVPLYEHGLSPRVRGNRLRAAAP